MAVGFPFSFFVCEHLPRFPLQSSPPFTTAAATILPLTRDFLLSIYSNEKFQNPTLAITLFNNRITMYTPFSFVYITLPLDKLKIDHSWQVIAKTVDLCGLTFSSVSTICIKYFEILGSIALYGDGPPDCPYLPVTYPDPIGSLPTLA
ncbi:hypothetical protein ALC62_11859 [Cyphomyrmex costatus]|uniref:Uncharacterized protein n=1 Tax=Cyphomyrmex costatus TaxID=456900 RepID=A0A195CA36_9HYME|nr:hypothetical protein ALC62_11859 [Cyphomyrmex costatus]